MILLQNNHLLQQVIALWMTGQIGYKQLVAKQGFPRFPWLQVFGLHVGT